ncbi:MAG TPA: phosphoribosylformylglycinamidine cyclo-ligase, partial [Desulfocapsa sulfexigens]|nr:phosphoribosylformylglycinamidine cyclo-ligase [Desulfocapsa sulfexigens]
MIAVDNDKVEDIVHLFQAHGEDASVIGEITSREDGEEQVNLLFE